MGFVFSESLIVPSWTVTSKVLSHWIVFEEFYLTITRAHWPPFGFLKADNFRLAALLFRVPSYLMRIKSS
jgi:hypothetical protein